MNPLFCFFLFCQLKYAISAASVNKEGILLSCSNQPKDIVLILDSSSSISEDDFEFAKDILVRLIIGWTAEKVENRVAFQQFTSISDVRYGFEALYKSEVRKVVENAFHLNGLTSIGKALEVTISSLIPNMRSNIPRFVILVTDGVNTATPSAFDASTQLKMSGVQLICLGIGDDMNITELKTIASENSALEIKDVNQLKRKMTEILDHSCYLPDPMPSMPCNVTQQDLIFLVDSSDSLTPSDFTNSISFVKEFISDPLIKLGTDYTRVAVITFSDFAKMEFDIDTYTQLTDYLRALDNVKKWGSITAIGKALDLTLNSILPKRRKSVPFNIIVITDGVNNIYPAPFIPGDKLKAAGAHIIPIGVGSEVNPEQLKQISTTNSYNNISSYSDLRANIPNLQMQVTCG